MTHYIESTIK